MLSVVLTASAAHAQKTESGRPGDTAWALPGIARVGVPATAERRIAVAGGAGYGFTEAQSDADGTHHRGSGSAAAAIAPLRELELSLRLDGRYDAHTDGPNGSHGGLVGDPRLLARYGTRLGDTFAAGLELVAWAPGEDAPSVAFDALSLDAKLLAAYRSSGGPTLAAAAGFRLDRSANAAPPLERLRLGDRLALGLSDTNAVLVGLGIAYPIGKTEVLGELSADLLVGSDAPDLSQSPMRVSAGARHALSAALAVEGLVEVVPSARPELDPTAPLVPVEPRVSVVLGVRYRFWPGAEPRKATPDAPARPPEARAPEVATPSALILRVEDEQGAPVSAARLKLQVGAFEREAEVSGGAQRIDGIPAGEGTIVVEAEGFEPAKEQRRFDAGKPVEMAIRLKPVPPAGEIRGLIRSFAGKGLAASIRVEPLGLEATSDKDGYFTLAVPPGEYEVVVRADRFKEQRRKVRVDENGVTVLNAELFEAK